ncbi:MAG: DUF4864 domain-containing protein [Cyanobacteriota bacterium]|nr:DUF4864 domain-containing protein [Cyanobacteriota bacterium]
MDLSPADRRAIRQTVERQLQALQDNDAETAFSFASPDIQNQFGTPENFMQMVVTAYEPVYRPRSVLFEEPTILRSVPAQPVFLLSRDGTPVTALYLMERQVNGSWRINGCFLIPVNSQTS